MNIKRGFTLIELLLVIGIVSVLASVMFFKVTEAKKKGDDAHMKAQTAQVSRAIYQYKDDNGGRVPGHTTVSGQGVRAILEREAGQTSTNQDYIDALQPLVTSGYLPSIPFSPSGDDYAYIISEDGFEGAFAADLYYEYESEEYNSCDFIEEEEEGSGSNSCNPVTISPPSFVSFALFRIPLPAQGGPTGSCTSGNLASLYGPPTYSCIDNNASTRSSCTCSNGLATSNSPSSVPHEACDAMFDTDCSVHTTSQPYSYFKAFAWSNSNYQAYQNYLVELAEYTVEYNQAVEEYNACMAGEDSGSDDGAICDGSNEDDWCSCF